MSESIEQLALRVAREMNPGFCTDEGLEGYADFLARCLAELAKQQEPVRWEVKAPTGTTIFYDEPGAENYASQWDAMGAYAGQGIATVKKVPAIPQPAAVSDVTDAMALAFHHALTDGSIGAGEVEEIKTGLRAALSAAPVPPTDERIAELAKQQSLSAVVISEVSDADREKIASAMVRSVSTFGKLGTMSSLYKLPADNRVAELERQRDELLEALECVLHLCEIIAAPDGPVLDKARAAIASAKGGGA